MANPNFSWSLNMTNGLCFNQPQTQNEGVGSGISDTMMDTSTSNNSSSHTHDLIHAFNMQLNTHKKEIHHLVQSLTECNYKFAEHSESFMSSVHATLQQSINTYKTQIRSLQHELDRMSSERQRQQQQFESEQQKKQEMARHILQFCERDLNPTQFEWFVGALFEALGYTVQHNGKTHDGGIDLLVRHYQRGKGIVQVKQYGKNSKVTEPQIRDLFGAFSAKNECDFCIMVVLSDCTKEAKTWPSREGVEDKLKIWTHKELLEVLLEHGWQCLLHFIKLLEQNHHRDLNQWMPAPGQGQGQGQTSSSSGNVFFTPQKFSHTQAHAHAYTHAQQSRPSQSYNGRNIVSQSTRSKMHRTAPSSTLSSAKKKRFILQPSSQSKNVDKENANTNENSPSNLHLNVSGQGGGAGGEIDANGEEPIGERQLTPTHSSPASSLLIDEECNDSDTEPNYGNSAHRASDDCADDGVQCTPQHRQQPLQPSLDLNTDFLWSLQNVTQKNEKRRPRRKWLLSDDEILMSKIVEFGSAWQESTEQWNAIYQACVDQLSTDFSIADIKKHWQRVLRQKLESSAQAAPMSTNSLQQ